MKIIYTYRHIYTYHHIYTYRTHPHLTPTQNGIRPGGQYCLEQSGSGASCCMPQLTMPSISL
jgi:hypothetical protein